jgi:hypothetical protein
MADTMSRGAQDEKCLWLDEFVRIPDSDATTVGVNEVAVAGGELFSCALRERYRILLLGPQRAGRSTAHAASVMQHPGCDRGITGESLFKDGALVFRGFASTPSASDGRSVPNAHKHTMPRSVERD